MNKAYKATCDLVIHTYLTYGYFSLFGLTSVNLNVDASKGNKKKFVQLESKELKENLSIF